MKLWQAPIRWLSICLRAMANSVPQTSNLILFFVNSSSYNTSIMSYPTSNLYNLQLLFFSLFFIISKYYKCKQGFIKKNYVFFNRSFGLLIIVLSHWYLYEWPSYIKQPFLSEFLYFSLFFLFLTILSIPYSFFCFCQ